MELEFQQSDFARLMFRIDEMPDKVDPYEYYPKLKKWTEFAPQKGKKGMSIIFKNRVFKYIVLMYDKESPFRVKISDTMKRKLEVARYVKMITNFNVIDPEVREIIRGENKAVNGMIIAYVRMHRNSQYALVVGLENMFYDGLFLIQNGGTPKKQITTTQRELEDAVTELLNQDNDKSSELRDDLFSYIEEERLNDLRPEGIADIFASGKKPFEGEDIDYNDDDI